MIVGALNWLLVGLFGFDLVAAISGNQFGERNAFSNIIYILVGLAGIVLIPSIADTGRPATTATRRPPH